MSHAIATNDHESSRAMARELQGLAKNPPERWFGPHEPLSGFPALAADQPLRRLMAELQPEDWQQIADADPDYLAAGLGRLRDLGAARVEHDRVVGADFLAAIGGEEAALVRLRDAGESKVAIFAAARARAGLDGLDQLSEAELVNQLGDMRAAPPQIVQIWLDDLVEMADQASQDWAEAQMGYEDEDDGWDRGMLRACSDYDDVRDYEEGDAPGRHYR